MAKYNFIDLFSGCGGFSLGLSIAGLQGQFAIEKDLMAFSTFADNLLGERDVPVSKFAWPAWLPQRAWPIDDFLAEHQDDLEQLRGKIQVIAGGPPCQGFSFAGKRNEADPRNMLFEKYVQVVKAIQPDALVLENVPGMKVAHKSKQVDSPSNTANATLEKPLSFYDKLKDSLNAIGYEVHGQIVNAAIFGVPQRRSRLIVIGIKKDLAAHLKGGVMRAFALLESARKQQLQDWNLPEKVKAKSALSDLEITGNALQKCMDPFSSPRFQEMIYKGPRTIFQKLMHSGCQDNEMNSIRLACHTPVVLERFTKIIAGCTKGSNMNKEDRAIHGLTKHRTFVMSAEEPGPTMTTLPDDVIHYSEPRILTVREMARLQTFPDWFHFQGKFTTGGKQRTKECPRYTQVGNAVPPFLARAIGRAITDALDEAHLASDTNKSKEKQMMVTA
jgi:DNA (cytosine-5)-methyltransferase 1